MKYTLLYIVLFYSLFNTSCVPQKTATNLREQSLPEKFGKSVVEKPIGHLYWKEIFTDTLLVQLIDTALANNYDLKLALQRVEMSKSYILAAKAKLAPTMDAAVGTAMRRFGLYTMDGAGNSSTDILPGKRVPTNLPDLFLGVQSSWEIDVFKKLSNRKKSAIAQMLATTEGANYVKSNIVAQVAILYYQLLAFDNELELLQLTIKKQEEALEVILVQKEAGRATELAIQQFKAQILNTKAMEKEIQQRIVETENNLHLLLGQFPRNIKRNKNSLFQSFSLDMNPGLPSQLLENRPDIKEATLLVEAANLDIAIAKAAFLPTFNITANLGFQAFRPDLLFLTPTSIAYNALSNITTPLLNRQALKANFQLAGNNQVNALYQYQQKVLNAYIEVSNQLSNLENLQKINVLKKEQTELLTNSVETSTILYRTARATYLEVLLAQQNALQSNMELINANMLQKMAKINLYKSLGGGWR